MRRLFFATQPGGIKSNLNYPEQIKKTDKNKSKDTEANIRKLRIQLLAAGAIALLMLAGLSAGMLFQSHRQASLSAGENARNITLMAERAIQRNIEVISAALDRLVFRYQYAPDTALPPAQLAAYLFGSNVKNLIFSAILDANGALVSQSQSGGQEITDAAAGKRFFQVHRDAPDAGLFISAPLDVKLGRPRQAIVLSKRLAHQDGSFAGVALMALDLEYFRETFEDLALNEYGFIALFSEDGTVYMRYPYSASMVGYRFQENANIDRIKAHPETQQGSFFATSPKDHVERFYTYHRIPNTKLIVLLSYSKASIYRHWREMLHTILALLISIVIVYYLLYRSLRRELHARLAVEEKLSELAQKDALTGLLNRRRLDQILQDLWQSSHRNAHSEFSILFIDVDYFKFYNDSYGHQAGDKVLVSVAQTITRALPRASDHAARYGGEEFVVLLSQTGSDGARLVAERIRSAVEQLAIPHNTSQTGIVTVSIGVATLREHAHTRIEELIKAADSALYRAKGNGRNNVQLSAA